MQSYLRPGTALALLPLLLTASACLQPPPPALQVLQPSQSNPVQAAATPAAVNDNRTVSYTETTSTQESAVQIILVHYRGTLAPLGCCNNLLYERDEYVAIKNTGALTRDISGWKLVNLTRGYPSFTFPVYYPCIPVNVKDDKDKIVTAESHDSYVENPPDSVTSRYSNDKGIAIINQQKVNWAQCDPVDPLDETPMKPSIWEEGKPAPCILYPGQTILVFTDEIHCQYGGFSFKYGPGNIWNNNAADMAVLYNAEGSEVSRRSYLTGR